MPAIESGGIVGFSARDVISDAINVCTGSLPGVGIHHVGILCRHGRCDFGRMLLYESTSAERPPCFFAGVGARPAGVGARSLETIQEFYAETGTNLWYYPLRSPLYEHEISRLDQWLRNKVGQPYDMDGAIHSGGGLIFRTLSILLRGEDLASFFCSEMCIGGLVHVGRVQTNNVSKWNPNRSVRYLVKAGVCDKPTRIL